MDINEYMRASLANQAKIHEQLAAVVAHLAVVAANTKILGKADVKLNGETIEHTTKVTPADVPLEEANKVARETAVAAQEASKAKKEEAKGEPAGGKPEAGAASSEKKAKKVTTDDVRAALKAYAGINGNPAAMELLSKHGSASVSALEESKYADFIKDCQ